MSYFFENFGLILFVLIGIVWIVTLIQSHRMFYLFRRKYPEIAKKEISYAFEAYRNPEKLFYFFRKKNIRFLKYDRNIWHLRQQVKLLLFLSIGIPFGVIVFISIFFLIKQ